MPATIFVVDSKPIVFGLDWIPLTGETSEKREVRQLAKDSQSAYYVRCTSIHSLMYGLLSKADIEELPEKRGFISAAMLFANCKDVEGSERAMFLEVEAQQAKLLVIENGVPYPGGDFFGSVDEAEEIIARIQQDVGEQFPMYGNYSQVYGHAIPLSLTEIVETADIESARLIKAKKGVDTRLVVLALIALIAAGGFGYMEYERSQKQARMLAERAKQGGDPVAKYWDAVRAELPQAGLPASAASKVFLSGWTAQEVLVAGWRLGGLRCTTDQCTYRWIIAGGTNQSLRNALGEKPYQFALDDGDIQYSLPNPESTGIVLSIDRLPSLSSFMLTTGSLAQEMRLIKMKVEFKQPTPFAAAAITDMGAVRNPIRFGEMAIEGDLALLRDVFARLPANTTIKSMDVKLDGLQSAFKIEGNYYVQD